MLRTRGNERDANASSDRCQDRLHIISLLRHVRYKALFAAPGVDLSRESGPTRTPQGQETHFIQLAKVGRKTHALKAWG
jgi:hypothetical protein